MWMLDGDPEFEGLIKYALTADNFVNTTVLLVVPMDQPWCILESLQKYSVLLNRHINQLGLSADILQKQKDKGLIYICLQRLFIYKDYLFNTFGQVWWQSFNIFDWIWRENQLINRVVKWKNIILHSLVMRHFLEFDNPEVRWADESPFRHRCYLGGKSTDDLLPIPEDCTLTCNLGIPVVVALTKVGQTEWLTGNAFGHLLKLLFSLNGA